MDLRVALLDVDGTLRHERTWNPGALDLVRTLQEAGLEVALCSGRPHGSMWALAEELGVRIVAAASGAFVWERGTTGWQLVESRELGDDACADAVDACRAVDGELWAFTADDWVVERHTDGSRHEAHIVDLQPVVTDLTPVRAVGKYLFYLHTPDDAARVRGVLTRDDVALVSSGGRYLDVVRRDVFEDKGGAAILRRLGADWRSTIAIGDNENDLGMLRRARVAVVVGSMGLDRLGGPPDGARRMAVGSTAGALEWAREYFGS